MKRTTSNCRGFTVVEFAVASLITMIILAATMSLIRTVFTASASIGQVMQTQQNLRVAMNAITREITMAGTGLPTGGIAVPNGANAVSLTRPGIGGTLATPNNSIAVVAPADGAGPTINGVATDAITITTIDQDAQSWTVKTFDGTGTDLEFVQEVRSGMFQLFAGDLLVLTNANGSVFGCVSDVSTMASHASFLNADAMNVNQPNAASGNVKSIKNGGDGSTTATRINVVTYYIDNADPSHPKLMRAANAAAPQTIAEDVENMQFAFDLYNFTNNTESTNQSDTASPNQIRSVNISLSGRSPSVLPKNHKYYRLSLISKVNVRNNTFRDRYTGS